MDILIVAPHSYCTEGYVRNCDRRAYETAKRLGQLINNRTQINPTIIYSDRPRAEMDYNRIASRYSGVRDQVRDFLNVAGPKIIFEVHSFPNRSRGFGENHVGFLAIDHEPYQTQMERAAAYISDRSGGKIKIYAGQGSLANDLQLETSSRSDIIHYLIEFNESYDIMTDYQRDQVLEFLLDLHKIGLNRIDDGLNISGTMHLPFAKILIIAICLVGLLLIIFFVTEIVFDYSSKSDVV